jgi:hypothetical protein
MTDLCKDLDGRVYRLVCENLARAEGDCRVANSLTLGFLDGEKIIGGIIYTMVGKMCFLTIWAENPKWCSRTNLARIFGLGFAGGAAVIKCATDYSNRRVNKLLRGLGFRREGILRFARDNGHDEIVWGLTETEMKSQKWFTTIRNEKCQKL